MKDDLILSWTGHRPDKLGGYGESAKKQSVIAGIEMALDELRPVRCITGMALGVDQWVARVCIRRGIPFTAALPFRDQRKAWPIEAQREYVEILSHAAEIVVVSPGPYAIWKMQVRNEWMVDHCGILAAVWDGTDGGTKNCVDYAKKKSKEIYRVKF